VETDAMKVSIIVAVYNEATTIGPVLDEVDRVPLDKEVIVVDDGSLDATPQILDDHPTPIRIVHLPTNSGKGAAIRRGIELSVGEIIVIQDADLELSPARIVHLVAPIEAGEADAVFGSRFLESGERVAWTRRGANQLLTGLTNRVHGLHLTDMETAHKAFRRDLVDVSRLRATRFEIEIELTVALARAGARILEIPNPYRPRTKLEGKKIRSRDGLIAIATILRLRFGRRTAGGPPTRFRRVERR
jgi:glycosyltransferase involved in cell wall biosynthesis